MTNKLKQDTYLVKALSVAIALILLCAIISALGFFWFLPAFGIVIAISAAAWSVVISTIFLLCIAVLLFFIVPFFLVFLFSFLAFFGVITVIVLFPIFFPFVAPLLIILLFLGYWRRKKQKK